MEKKIWSKPEMNEFAFAANEYVAACGDENKIYNFDCNAPAGWVLGRPLYYYENAKVDADVGMPTDWSTRTDAVEVGNYRPCGDTHSTPVSSDYYWGFVDTDWNGVHRYEEEVIDLPVVGTIKRAIETVIVWLERDEQGKIVNGHATPDLDMRSWTTSKS